MFSRFLSASEGRQSNIRISGSGSWIDRQLLKSLVCALLWMPACGGEPGPVAGAQVRMDYASTDVLGAPWPSEHRRADDGRLVDFPFPNPRDITLVRDATAIVRDESHGFSTSAGVFFSLSAAPSVERLPSLAASVTEDANVFLMDVTESSPERGVRRPIETEFAEDAGPFGGPRVLSLLPLQGVPLRPRTTYAAAVLRRLNDAVGQPLGVSESMARLAGGVRPRGVGERAFAVYRAALAVLAERGVRAVDVAGLAVFTTDDPLATFARARSTLAARPVPTPSAFVPAEVFPDYCVFAATLAMPDFQAGEPPYTAEGGDWRFDADGRLVHQRDAMANLVVTLPRRAMPENGFPTVVFVRTGGGGERPLVDRGRRGTAGGPALQPGTGMAMHFARAGYAGVSVDGPHGGLRNPTRADEQLLVFNITNARALRDNVRESALELTLLPDVLARLRIDATGCAGARTPTGGAELRLDGRQLALMGHSMGATIAPLTAAFEPRYTTLLLSGAGGSWIENIRFKQKPLDVRSIAELLLGYPANTLRAHDPVLSLVQWAAEGADPQVYARRLVREPAAGEAPRHVLMMQGIVDHYILPRIATGLSAALGLDLAGDVLDDPIVLARREPELALQRSHAMVLPLIGRGVIALPARGNITDRTTAVVVQYPGDALEDGHEAVFQTEPPQRAVRCFLESLTRGTPTVPAHAPNDTRCP